MTQTLTGQDIGLAFYATRALLEAALADSGTNFESWLAVNNVATDNAAVDRAIIVARLSNGLKVSEAAASNALDDTIAAGLLTQVEDSSFRLTEAGDALFAQVTKEIDRIVEVVYGGLPADDLATAHRVLVTVKDRANAALAAAS